MANRKEYMAEYHKNNKESIALRQKNQRQKDKAAVLERAKQYYQNNKDLSRQYYQENKDRISKRTKEYMQTLRGKMAGVNKDQTRKARKKNQLGPNPPATEQLVELLQKPCVYCGKKSEHIDHIIPLAKGGLHDITNVIGACGRCNKQKGAKHLSEWLTYLGEINGRTSRTFEQADGDPDESIP